jgi:DNA excision repair protein ERCC-2
MSLPNSKPVHTVSVRDLVQFVLREGDLGGARQFVGSDRALAGIRGHQKIQRSRPAAYQTEVPVEIMVEGEDFTLHIRGRIDGLLVMAHEVLLEEIKTVQGIWDQAADPLHWAQAKFYGYIYARDHVLDEMVVQLTYLELTTEKVTEFRETFNRDDLATFFSETTAIYSDWVRQQYRWVRERNDSIRLLSFPFPKYRPGQRELAVSSYRILSEGGRLFLGAPTGIGKTVSVLFPAIKALGEGKLERLFYLTARTIGRAVAEKSLADLRQVGLKLRAVTLTAKQKVCVRDGQPCNQLTCPLALGYFDRIKPAIRDALQREEITRSTLKAVSEKHQVCPFELSLDVSVWADAVICDYNYVFDPQAYLRRHFADDGGQYGFLVDEAHNLVDRAREMFSADLDANEINEVRRAIKSSVPRLAKALTKLSAAMQTLINHYADSQEPIEPSNPLSELNLFPSQAPAAVTGREGVNSHREFPDRLVEPIESALAEAEMWLARNVPSVFGEDLLAFYFRLHAFRRTAEVYDDHFVTIIDSQPEIKMRLFCLNPSKLLRQALNRGKATIFFSATLAPMDYYRTLLGGEPEDPVLQLPSPFSPENLAVLIQDRIQTHFKGRAESLSDVVAAIGALVQGRRGNYLVYFPSYQYLNSVLQEFQSKYPVISVLAQKPGMTELERDAFLAAFSVEHGETLAGFAVLGGIFGEGIDLVGERLIGAIIVGVGLPQLCVERDLIRDYFQEQNSAGFDYAYTFPGMNRVLQAVGRVIRSDIDRGVVLLIDARFNELRYRRLFPAWWKYTKVRNVEALRGAMNSFWHDNGENE